MFAAVLAGVLIVAFVATQQLGGRADADAFGDPGLPYPAELMDGSAIGRVDCRRTRWVGIGVSSVTAFSSSRF